MVSSHSLTGINNNYKKPIISKKSNKFKLKRSRHPVVEKLLPLNEKFITNDIELDNKKKQISQLAFILLINLVQKILSITTENWVVSSNFKLII